MTRSTLFRRTLAGVTLGAIASLGLLVAASPAQAHNYLVSSTPAADSTLTELPAAFEITTNDDLLEVGDGAGAFALQVLDAGGLYYGDGCVTVAGATMSSTPALGDPGVYTVRWQVVSADGHTVSDEYTFTWAPTTTADVATGSATAPVCGQAVPSATPEPSASASESGPTTTTDSAAPSASPELTASDDGGSTALWIGGAVVLIGAAVVITLLVTGRKKKA